MTGAWLPVATLIEKGARAALAAPSDTEIMMLLYVPVWVLLGVPDKRPVVVLNVAQAGLLATTKVSVSPSGSDAVGTKS
jgi:hypothetical protein